MFGERFRGIDDDVEECLDGGGDFEEWRVALQGKCRRSVPCGMLARAVGERVVECKEMERMGSPGKGVRELGTRMGMGFCLADSGESRYKVEL